MSWVENEMLQQYSNDEIVALTSNFAEEIGCGEFSVVYKGQLINGVYVAVKVLRPNVVVQELFKVKVKAIGATNHQHLTKLYGFCFQNFTKALVYEFLENGSLNAVLNDRSFDIDFEKMYGIAVQTAKGLAYLHHQCKIPIIHCNVRPANVLFDVNYAIKHTDFGMSFHSTSRGDGQSTLRHFYTAPEVQVGGHSFKSDVYGFGKILFEMLRRTLNSGEKHGFPKHVWATFNDNELDEFLEDHGMSEEDRKRAAILATVALWCVQDTAQTRPSMSTVAIVLENQRHVNMPPDPFSSPDPAILMQPEMSYTLAHSSVSDHNVDTMQKCDSVKIEAAAADVRSGSFEEQVMPDNEGREDVDNQQNNNSDEPEVAVNDARSGGFDGQIMHYNQSSGNGADNKNMQNYVKYVQKYVNYVEKKRSITNEVCGSILAKMDELQIGSNIFEEVKNFVESRTHLKMKQSLTDEVCKSILKIMKEV